MGAVGMNAVMKQLSSRLSNRLSAFSPRPAGACESWGRIAKPAQMHGKYGRLA